MPLASELSLPEFDHTDAALRGDRYREAMGALHGHDGWLDALPADGRCEFIADFAKPYPSLVIAAVMGVDRRWAPKLHEWSNVIQRQFDPASLTEGRPVIEAAVAEFYAWAHELITARRGSPGAGLITD